jgi:hypothetical protein
LTWFCPSFDNIIWFANRLQENSVFNAIGHATAVNIFCCLTDDDAIDNCLNRRLTLINGLHRRRSWSNEEIADFGNKLQ